MDRMLVIAGTATIGKNAPNTGPGTPNIAKVVTGLGTEFKDKKTGKTMQYAYFDKPKTKFVGRAASTRPATKKPSAKPAVKLSQAELEHRAWDLGHTEYEQYIND